MEAGPRSGTTQLWVRCTSSTRVTDRHRSLALQLGQPVRELPDLPVASPRTVRRSQLVGLTRSRSSRSPVASRKPGDERADLPGLRGSLIIPFPPARAATPAPAVSPRGPRDHAVADVFDFLARQRGRGQFRHQLGRSAVYRAASPQDSTSAILRRFAAAISAPGCRRCSARWSCTGTKARTGRPGQAAARSSGGPPPRGAGHRHEHAH
jgi:hypothetical protein